MISNIIVILKVIIKALNREMILSKKDNLIINEKFKEMKLLDKKLTKINKASGKASDRLIKFLDKKIKRTND